MAANSLVHDQRQSALLILNQSSQSFDLATSKGRGVPRLSNPDVSPLAQHHTSPLHQAANVQDHDEPFNELDILDFDSDDADSIDENLLDWNPEALPTNTVVVNKFRLHH